MSVEPIKPDSIEIEKAATIPDQIVEAFNELIAMHWDGHSSRVLLKDAIKLSLSKMPDMTRQKIGDKNYMDVEDLFRLSGWLVRFESPDYSESFDSYYTFRK